MTDHIYRSETPKSSATFARDFTSVARKNGFIIDNLPHMDMAEKFKKHGVDVDEEFDLHMIQLCKPDRASVSLQYNPERSVLMPKFVMVFSNGRETQVRFHHYSHENITKLVDDEKFPESLAGTYQKIISMIEESI